MEGGSLDRKFKSSRGRKQAKREGDVWTESCARRSRMLRGVLLSAVCETFVFEFNALGHSTQFNALAILPV
jgi:hypothetical protein